MSCPICEKASDPLYKPFCSKRCADIDLGKWLGGGYALPSSDPDDADALIEAMEQALEEQVNADDEKLH
ncbi:DNA gyrase inhibitor YacG [Planktotalea arctica]|uniref:DNA gyrase inhibitor YacG n=1 Tax=Planktotalea arctica TaxID=1481893 RepID=UPI000A174164|nr:DNA gyrase inhibitor YacG [Planktotalea arctica]